MTFKYLTSINIDENLHLVIEDSVKREQVRKYAHYYSHNLTTIRLLTLSNVSECEEVVSIVLDEINRIDHIHFESLVSKITE